MENETQSLVLADKPADKPDDRAFKVLMPPDMRTGVPVERDPIHGISTEAALAGVLGRLAADRSRGAAIATASVEEALRQIRKRLPAVCDATGA